MRQHHFKDSGIDVLPLGDPVDLAAVTADDALIDALSGDVLAAMLADDVLIEALVARMPPGTAPPRGDVLAGLLVELLAAWVAEAREVRAATSPQDVRLCSGATSWRTLGSVTHDDAVTDLLPG